MPKQDFSGGKRSNGGKSFVRRRRSSKLPPPKPLHLPEWRLNVEQSLGFKVAKELDQNEMRAAVDEVLRSCLTFKSQVTQPREKPRSDRRRTTMPALLRRLRDSMNLISTELLSTTDDGDILPSRQLSHALVATRFRHASTDLETLAAFLSLDPLADEEVVQALLNTRYAAKMLAEELEAQIAKSSLGPVKIHPRKAHVRRLMIIFGKYRGEELSEIPIGNPDEDYNPLMRFLKAVNRPIARVEDFPVHIPGETLRKDATQLRGRRQSR